MQKRQAASNQEQKNQGQTQAELEREVSNHLAKYGFADNKRALWELGTSLLGYVVFLLLIPTHPIFSVFCGCFLLRVFVIFHDCCHKSFFDKPEYNEMCGHIIGGLLLTPYDRWKNRHNGHHANFGQLEFSYDTGTTVFFSKHQYQNLPLWQRIFWRIFRSPLVFFAAVPFVKWGFEYPLIRGTIYTFIGYAWMITSAYIFGPWSLFGNFLAAFLGIQLFHLQHSIEVGYRAPLKEWSFFDSAFKGSTYAPLPPILNYFSLGIEYHHIHHYNPKVPGYKLAECHHANEQLWKKLEVTEVSFKKYLISLFYFYWDEDKNNFATYFEF